MHTVITHRQKMILGFFLAVLCGILLWYSYVRRHAPVHVATAPLEEIEDNHNDSAHEEQLLSAALGNADLHPLAKTKYLVDENTPQFVILSFDGSKSVDMLNETLDFQQRLALEGKSLHFTYFINAAYLLTKDTASVYTPPEHPQGTSNIGFSNTSADIPKRIRDFNQALVLGDEIGSHTVGHFDGSTWSYDEWKKEFDSFNSILTNVQKNNSATAIDAPRFTPTTIKGFRAPQLGVNDNLYKVLDDYNFGYDTSGIGKPGEWPTKDVHGLWHIPLGIIRLGGLGASTVAMDYSIWMHQSGAQEIAKKGTPLWQEYYDEVTAGYQNYFDTNYQGSRAPVVIGHHFAKWNDGVYWEAMKAFAENVCGRPQVQCVTFGTLVNYLNTQGPPKTI